MNAIKLRDQLALAAWELAEAETLENAARVKRKNAAMMIGQAHAEVKAALEEAYQIKIRERQGFALLSPAEAGLGELQAAREVGQ